MLDQQAVAPSETVVLPPSTAHVEEYMHLLGRILTEIICDWLKNHPDTGSSGAGVGRGRRRARGAAHAPESEAHSVST